MVEHQIESRLVLTKAAVVASSDKLARKLRAALGELVGALVDVTEADGLGTTTCTAEGLVTKKAK